MENKCEAESLEYSAGKKYGAENEKVRDSWNGDEKKNFIERGRESNY